jgi:hypothetical protein
MGIDANRLLNPPEDNVLCMLCRGVLCDPLAAPCGHFFCEMCISPPGTIPSLGFNHDDSRTCPYCQIRFPSSRLLVDHAKRDEISALLVRCENYSRGCHQTITLGQSAQHVCNHAPVECIFPGCRFSHGKPIKLNRCDFDNHRQTCEWRTTKCSRCKSVFPAKHQQIHESQCIKRASVCPQMCGVAVTPETLAHHLEHLCPRTATCCEIEGCDFAAPQSDTHSWTTHNTTAQGKHTRLMMAHMKRKSEEVSRLTQVS